MGEVIISVPARDDLQEIWDYLGARNPDAANRLLGELRDKFALLARNPYLGKACPGLMVNLHSFPHKNYQIFYLPTAQGVEIYRIVHGSRDIEALFSRFFDDLGLGE